MSDDDTIACPHCLSTDVHRQATTCQHCGKRVEYGVGWWARIAFITLVAILAGSWVAALLLKSA